MPVMTSEEERFHEIFVAFATYGTRQQPQAEPQMDGAKFVKLCKDCHLIGAGFTVTDADLIFSKVKAKGSRKITYEQFLEAVRQVAMRKNMSVSDVEGMILASPGPMTLATKPEYVKFHDDKNTYTGVYARGGPTNVDQKPYLYTYRA